MELRRRAFVLHPGDPGDMHAHLDRVSAQFEDRLAPKRPWTTGKMPEDVLERMMRQILPFRLEVQDVQGTWKLNQNKTEGARAGAAERVKGSPIGQELAALSALMSGGLPGAGGK